MEGGEGELSLLISGVAGGEGESYAYIVLFFLPSLSQYACFITLSKPVINSTLYMYTIVHSHQLYASACAVTFDNLHPVQQLPRDAAAFDDDSSMQYCLQECVCVCVCVCVCAYLVWLEDKSLISSLCLGVF